MELMLRQPFQETPCLQDHQWQSTSLPESDEKESIIAHTDFKVCSFLAMRRLSSKKRKKPMEGGEGEHVATEMGASRSSHSPAEGPTLIRDLSYYQNSTHRTPCYYQGSPATASGGVPVPPGGQYVSVAQGFPLVSTPSIGMLSKQFSNPVLNQLNYRFIQDQRMFVPTLLGPALSCTESGGAQSSSPQHEQVQPCSHSGVKKPFKWCYAHVMVARQIHQHQMQIKATSEQSRHHCAGQSNVAPLAQQEHHIQHLKHQQQHLQHQQQHHQHQKQHQRHQQQQLLLFQMYGCLPHSGVVPGGYVSLPYAPPLQDHLQLGYIPQQSISLAPSAVSLVKPAPQTSGISAPELNVHLSGALQLAPTVAALAPVPELTNVFPGAPWITPVPVFGSYIVNPFHPGVLASWVK